MVLRPYLTPAAVVLAAGSAFAGVGKDDYAARLALVEGARLDAGFSVVAVKADRPMPWPSFAALRSAQLEGTGPGLRAPSSAAFRTKGDLGPDARAAVWLAALDDDYRNNGRLLFVRGGGVPGIPRDRWLSLAEFEREVMPTVVHTPAVFNDAASRKPTEDLVRRATALHYLAWDELPLVPGDATAGWKPLGAGTPAYRDAAALEAAYNARDAAAMRAAAARLAAALAAQPGYPPQYKLRLEVWWGRLRLADAGFVLFAASALMLIMWLIIGKRFFSTAGLAAAGAGFAVLTAALAARAVIGGRIPVTGYHEYLLTIAWAAALFFFAFAARTKQTAPGAAVMLAAASAVAGAAFFSADIPGFLEPVLRSRWRVVQMTLTCLAAGAFAVASGAALPRLVRRPGRPGRILPDNETLEDLERRAVAWGYTMYTAGALVAGALWSHQEWGTWWRWAPGETAALIVWTVATIYIHGRTLPGWRKTNSALFAVLVFGSAVAALFADLIFGGLPAARA